MPETVTGVNRIIPKKKTDAAFDVLLDRFIFIVKRDSNLPDGEAEVLIRAAGTIVKRAFDDLHDIAECLDCIATEITRGINVVT